MEFLSLQTVNHTSAAPSVDGRTSDGENEAPEDDVSVSVDNASLSLQANNKRGAGRPPKGPAPADPIKTGKCIIAGSRNQLMPFFS